MTGNITLTANWTENVVVPTEYTVKFVDAEGNVLASEVVAPGANASIPALGGDTYFAYDLAQLMNIQADTTILVTPVAKTGYAEKDYFISQDMINNDERVTFDGFNAAWGALLWKQGQSFSITENFGGKLYLKPYAPADKFAEGQSMTIEVSVDGYALARYVIDGAFVRQYYTVHANLPVGQHTLTITVVETVGISSFDKYSCSVGLANFRFQELLPPPVEHTVTFAGEGVNVPAQTVADGGVAQKPADPVREGFTFAGWTLDGVAYDFTAPVTGNITLTANWTENVVVPTEYTVTFVDGEGNVIVAQTVAPGTKGSTVFSITGTPEVAANIKINFVATSDIMLPADSAEGQDEEYHPLVFTLKQTHDYQGEMATPTVLFSGTLAQLEAALANFSANYAPNTILDSTYELSWEWAFENAGMDAADTLLGDIIAGVEPNNVGAVTAVKYDLSITVTQID